MLVPLQMYSSSFSVFSFLFHFWFFFTKTSSITARFGYASLYGELPEFELKKNQNALAPSGASERRWETIFSGPSHNLPPLTKLCSEFLESLLEKRTVAVEWLDPPEIYLIVIPVLSSRWNQILQGEYDKRLEALLSFHWHSARD